MDEITLLRQIASAATMVRDRQNAYFHARQSGTRNTQNLLGLSRSAETQLDKLLTTYHCGNYGGQEDLFADPAEPP